MVRSYLASGPNPDLYQFLQQDFRQLVDRFGGVTATTFKNFPSYPQRYMEALEAAPIDPAVKVERLKPQTQPLVYTADDLHLRQFTEATTRRLTRTEQAA
jgi:hypothetical protein